MNATTLLANTTGTPVGYFWKGGSGSFAAIGTFGGGTLSMQWCMDGADPTNAANWIDIVDSTGTIKSLTAKGLFNFSLSTGQVRPLLSGSTSPSINFNFGHIEVAQLTPTNKANSE